MPAVKQDFNIETITADETFEWAPAMAAGEEETLEEIVTRYENTVFTLAMHLTSDEESAREVTIEVFIRLSREAHHHREQCLDQLIHRFTYDAALPRLLGRIDAMVTGSLSVGLELAGIPEDAEKGYIC